MCAKMICNGVHNVDMVNAMLQHASMDVIDTGLKTASTLSGMLNWSPKFPMYMHLVLSGVLDRIVALLSHEAPGRVAAAAACVTRLLDSSSLLAFMLVQAGIIPTLVQLLQHDDLNVVRGAWQPPRLASVLPICLCVRHIVAAKNGHQCGPRSALVADMLV